MITAEDIAYIWKNGTATGRTADRGPDMPAVDFEMIRDTIMNAEFHFQVDGSLTDEDCQTLADQFNSNTPADYPEYAEPPF